MYKDRLAGSSSLSRVLKCYSVLCPSSQLLVFHNICAVYLSFIHLFVHRLSASHLVSREKFVVD